MPDERFSLMVCPWTAAHPRHDPQQIFPLLDGRLMLIWSEYYADRPSFVSRTLYSKAGSQSDLMPCRLSAKLSSDRGRSWTDLPLDGARLLAGAEDLSRRLAV